MTTDEFIALDGRVENARRLFLCQKHFLDCRSAILEYERLGQIADAMRGLSDVLEARTRADGSPDLRSPEMIAELKQAIASILAKYAEKFQQKFYET